MANLLLLFLSLESKSSFPLRVFQLLIKVSQPFWGNMVAARGAGPKPIPHKQLTAQNLSEAITFCLTPSAHEAAQEIAHSMQKESGVRTAVNSFHANLPLEKLTCDILPNQPASWLYKRKSKNIAMKLSKLAVEMLTSTHGLETKKLELYESKPVHIETRYYDPVSGAVTAYAGTGIDMIEAAAGMIIKPYKEYKVGRTKTSTKSITSSDASVRSASSRSSSSTQLDSVSTGLSDLSMTSQSKKSMDLSSTTPGIGCTAARMAGASAKSFGSFNHRFFQGILVDVPLATAEGLRNVPALYGDKIRDHGTVTDWKSGAMVGGKAFMYGVGEGLTDIFVEPIKGGKKEGVLGVAKGVGRGGVTLLSKTGYGKFFSFLIYSSFLFLFPTLFSILSLKNCEQ